MSQIDGFVLTAKPAVYFGPGTVGELPAVVWATGADRVVVVTDTALASDSVVERVLTVLADAGLPARLFAGVPPHPTPGDLAAGAEAVVQAAADAAITAAASASAAAVAAMLTPSAPMLTPSAPLVAPPLPATPPPPAGSAGPRIAVVAVGGGAAIDAAKGIAVAAGNPQRGRDLDGRPDFAVPALPIVAVPTTAGTGAETSALGLVTDPAGGRAFYAGHASAMPAAVILDPDLTVGLSPAVTAGCGVDALTHALESYLSLRPNPWSDGIALQVIRMVAASLPRAVMDGTDLAARSQLLLAAHLAGVAMASTGLGLCHAIGYSVGARWDIAPGAALAMLLPEVLRFNLPARIERMADVAFALGVGDTHADTWLNAEAAIGAVTALRADVGLNRLMSDFGITEADFAQIAADTLANEALASTPRPPTTDDIRAILQATAAQPR
jgi:alcohol dehydrogenase